MVQLAVICKNISKRYYLERPRSLKKWFRAVFSPFESLVVFKDFSLRVKRGECILVQGTNGSGKSTLLKLIAGITTADSGEIKTYGKVVPLIELGAGFNYELTGRENILINATILGISKGMIEKITPEVIEFAEIESFIDVPLKRYSTGMLSRLAFSIAVFSQPEILLLDEIFAVGDQQFRRKSIKRLKEFKKKGVTIILCSHFNFNASLFDRKIVLRKAN